MTLNDVMTTSGGPQHHRTRCQQSAWRTIGTISMHSLHMCQSWLQWSISVSANKCVCPCLSADTQKVCESVRCMSSVRLHMRGECINLLNSYTGNVFTFHVCIKHKVHLRKTTQNCGRKRNVWRLIPVTGWAQEWWNQKRRWYVRCHTERQTGTHRLPAYTVHSLLIVCDQVHSKDMVN